MYRITQVVLALITLLVISAASSANTFPAPTFDFEGLPLGTLYGSPAGHSPGDIVLSNWDVDMSVEDFSIGAFVGFNVAEVSGHPGPPTSFFPFGTNPTQSLTINNINAKFDFTGVPFDVTGVTLDYVDLGGAENFDINGIGRQEVPQLSALAPFPGFSVTVTENSIGSGVEGTVKIEALGGNRIDTLLIGGQEFGIDNVSKIPEPSSLTLLMAALLAIAGRLRRSLAGP